MIKNNNLTYSKLFLIGIIIGIFFISIGLFSFKKIENNIYNSKEKDSIEIANYYVGDFINSSNANKVINNLIREKIIVASNILSLEKKKIININLEKLSDLLEIDRIYYYNLSGEVIDSTTNKDTGWVAKKDHPVYEFIKSRKIFSVENNIRKDTCDNKYFKYGYYYIPNQGYIQIGIHADKVQDFLDSFEVERILNEMVSLDKIKNVAFIKDSKTNYFSRSNNEKLEIDTDLVDQILNEKKSLITKYSKNKSKYSVYLPIKLEKSIEGVLLTEFNLIDTKKSIQNFKLIATFILFLVYIIIIYVLTLNIKNKHKILSLAYYDNLTNLPNVNYFIDNYSEMINNVEAVFVIKFVSLETINMTYGYNYGSEILKQIANKLILYAQDKNIEIFKTKEDEFVMSWETHKTKQELIKSVKKINKIFSEKMEVKDAVIYLKFKIAVIDIRDSSLDLSDILKKSNIILKSLFNNKHKNYGFYDKVAEEKLKRHENIQNELRNIIENKNVNKKLYLNYQPFINTKNNEVVGFEALARFNSEKYGIVSPAEFINIAEKQGLIIQLTKIILKEAFNFIIKLNENGYKHLKVAVNISSIHLLSEDFEKELERLSPNKKYILNNLDLEITESVFLDDFDLINNKLKKLQDKGIKISLDDFGTGYSSFSRFSELNIDYLKIDKYFIDKILKDSNDYRIIKKIISMAHSFKIKTIAEGVEEIKQEKYLKKYKCDILQGYLYSKPVSEEKALEFLKKD